MPTAKKAHAKSKKSAKSIPAHKHPHYHRRLLLWLLLFFSIVLLWATLTKSQEQASSQYPQPTAMATFSGTTPCADCEGIKTSLTFFQNPSTYVLTLNYLGRDVKPVTENGTWTMEVKNGETIYTLQSDSTNSQKTMYQKIDDTQIRQLDGDGNPIPASLPFTLTKAN